jgi:hypothetical protein
MLRYITQIVNSLDIHYNYYKTIDLKISQLHIATHHHSSSSNQVPKTSLFDEFPHTRYKKKNHLLLRESSGARV